MLSHRVQSIGYSSTLRIADQAAQMKREGVDVIDLSVGEPDFPTPNTVCDAAKRAIDKGFTRYTANNGIAELRTAITDKYRTEHGADYTLDEVIVSTGAKQCLFNACLALLNDGDEVIIPVPYWVTYPHSVGLAGGIPIYIDKRVENGFRLTASDVERTLTAKAKAIIINHPCNPTGAVYDERQLREVVELCLDAGLIIIADEIYEKLVFDGVKFHSVASCGSKARASSVVVGGFSKSYSMTGWRLGWAVGPEAIIAGMSKVQSHSTSNANSIAQYAGLEALINPQPEIDQMRDKFEARRNFVIDRLNALPSVTCFKPQGAFYVFPEVSGYFGSRLDGARVRNSSELSEYLLMHAHVAVVPGDGFGADGYIRLSYATSTENLIRGLDRIENALAKLQR